MNSKQLIELEELIMKESAIASVYCQEILEGKILVKGFEGFLSDRELTIKYGEEIIDMYEQGNPFMRKEFFLKGDFRHSMVAINALDDVIYLHKGDIFDKKEFDKIVVTMKECGKRLCDIAAAFRRTDNIKKIKI